MNLRDLLRISVALLVSLQLLSTLNVYFNSKETKTDVLPSANSIRGTQDSRPSPRRPPATRSSEKPAEGALSADSIASELDEPFLLDASGQQTATQDKAKKKRADDAEQERTIPEPASSSGEEDKQLRADVDKGATTASPPEPLDVTLDDAVHDDPKVSNDVGVEKKDEGNKDDQEEADTHNLPLEPATRPSITDDDDHTPKASLSNHDTRRWQRALLLAEAKTIMQQGCADWHGGPSSRRVWAFGVVAKFFAAHQLEYIMNGGSALGIARLGLIAAPWDDDVDAMVLLSAAGRLALLAKDAPGVRDKLGARYPEFTLDASKYEDVTDQPPGRTIRHLLFETETGRAQIEQMAAWGMRRDSERQGGFLVFKERSSGACLYFRVWQGQFWKFGVATTCELRRNEDWKEANPDTWEDLVPGGDLFVGGRNVCEKEEKNEEEKEKGLLISVSNATTRDNGSRSRTKTGTTTRRPPQQVIACAKARDLFETFHWASTSKGRDASVAGELMSLSDIVAGGISGAELREVGAGITVPTMAAPLRDEYLDTLYPDWDVYGMVCPHGQFADWSHCAKRGKIKFPKDVVVEAMAASPQCVKLLEGSGGKGGLWWNADTAKRAKAATQHASGAVPETAAATATTTTMCAHPECDCRWMQRDAGAIQGCPVGDGTTCYAECCCRHIRRSDQLAVETDR